MMHERAIAFELAHPEEATMPPQSRAQRRRQSQRTGGVRGGPARPGAPSVAEVAPLEHGEADAAPARPVPAPSAARSARAGRRAAARSVEAVDYSQDYASARRDLTRIAIIGVLLLAVMIGLGVAGVF
jgi:predicted flap endonuclease-1-like 5' DNA nuclease